MSCKFALWDLTEGFYNFTENIRTLDITVIVHKDFEDVDGLIDKDFEIIEDGLLMVETRVPTF